MAAFQPKGSRALRVIVAELAAGASYGTVFTHAEIAKAIGEADDDLGKSKVRMAVTAARPVLLRDHRKTLIAVRGTGYRVALPGEFAGIAQDHRRKSDREIGKALAVIEHAPVQDMTKEELTRHRAVETAVRNLHRRLTSAEQRLADLEAAVYGPPRKVIKGEIENT